MNKYNYFIYYEWLGFNDFFFWFLSGSNDTFNGPIFKIKYMILWEAINKWEKKKWMLW